MQLYADGEPSQARFFPPLRIDAIDVGEAWALAEQLEQPPQGRPAAFGEDLDIAVGPVSNPAGETHLLGSTLNEVAEADSLDVAVDDRMEAGHLLATLGRRGG